MKHDSSFHGSVDIISGFIYMNTAFSSHIPKKGKGQSSRGLKLFYKHETWAGNMTFKRG
jgi:hypothetical protein